jgi:hypothetical protein
VGNTGTTINFNNGVRLSTTSSLLREQKPTFDELVRLELSGNGYADEAVVYTQAGASAAEDNYDAEKLHSEVAEVGNIYTLAGKVGMIVNALPATAADRVIPVGIRTQVAGTYTVKATELTQFTVGTQVYLEDRFLNKTVALNAGDAYSFTAGEGTVEGRFFLHITKGGAAQVAANTVVYAVGNEVRINSADADHVAAQVAVVDALGRTVLNHTNAAKALILTLNVPAATGVYFVKVTTAAGEMTKRVQLGN